MKKSVAALLTAALAFASINTMASVPAAAEEGDSLKIVVTIFPEYDWVREILGDLAEENELILLLDSNVDMHSYQPTAVDIMNISTSDLFVYVGGESDKWVADALREVVNKDQVVVNLLESLGDAVKAEEVVEGMEHEHDHEHEHAEIEEEEEEEEEEEVEMDEHVWLSLKNASALVNVLCGALMELDPENADTYSANAAAYTDKLNALDAEYTAALADTETDTLLFADRFPFRYLTEDYGLNYYAAFSGCSAETEASFETVVFLAQKLDELGLKHVMVIETSDGKLADTVIRSAQDTERDVLTLNSVQSVTASDIESGVTYYGIMQENLEVLKKALN